MTDTVLFASICMEPRDLLDFNVRKRKSGNLLDEIATKRVAKENSVPESTPKKLLRRFSAKIKHIGSNIKAKNKYNGSENIINEDESEDSNTFKSKDAKLGASFTYFSAPCSKKSSFPNDRLSNSSDTSRQSSTTSQHLKLGVDLFNWDPNCGIEYFRSNGVIIKDEDVAELFIKKKGFNKYRLFEFLTNKKNRSIHEKFCNLLDLKNKSITEVLREYLKISYITGEYSVMLGTIDLLSHAYLNQHVEGGIMGLNIEQIITIFQFLVTFNTSKQFDKQCPQVSREHFMKMLQESLTQKSQDNAINRQLAFCLYFDISESPLTQPIDEKTSNLEKISKLLVEIPKDFQLIKYDRYVICHVDLSEIALPVNGTEKPSFHDRTVFLFNDCMIITKKRGLIDTNSYRVKQIIYLSDIHCSFVKHNLSYSMHIVQITNSVSNDVIVSFHSKLFDDCTKFYTTLEQAISFYKSVVDYQKFYQAKSR